MKRPVSADTSKGAVYSEDHAKQLLRNENENMLSIWIKAPLEKVRDFTMDNKRTPDWIYNIKEEVRIGDSEEVRVGDTYKNRPDENGKWTEYKVIAVEPNMFALAQKGSTYEVFYLYAPSPRKKGSSEHEDGTTLIYYEKIAFGKLEDPFTAVPLERLKTVIERESGAGQSA